MGYYSEYLDLQLNFADLTAERKKQLKRISELRGNRDVLVYAADLNKGGNVRIDLNHSDLLPIHDQLSNLQGNGLDLILETPGGSGEAAEDIVRLIRGKYMDFGVIVPGWAKSAGTILAMAGDEILMEPASALGPIDAQIIWQGKQFSSGELLDGMDKIKAEVEATGVLNKAYIPILQNISPGELQRAANARKFAEKLLTDWLAKYKFKNWNTHSSTGAEVTQEDKEHRASEIANQLSDHSRWLTHARSIKIEDFEAMKLKIVDYSKVPDLAEAIRRYYTLLQMTFESTSIYKIFETPETQVVRFIAPQAPVAGPTVADIVDVEVACNRCKTATKVQANVGDQRPLRPGAVPFPADNRLACPGCGNIIDLTDARRQIEAQTKKPVVS